MRGEGGVDGGDHVVLVLGHGVRVVMERVLVARLHWSQVSLHSQQRAVWVGLLIVDVDAAEVASAHVGVDDMAIGEDVGQGALVTELAVALMRVSICWRWGSCERRLSLVKYLQGARSVTGSSECRNGQAFPAWHAPWR